MKSTLTSPLLLKRIDALILPCHPYLREEDEAYFLGEYTVGALSAYSPTNQLIFNYKKSLDRREHPDWSYKERAIDQVARLFSIAIFNTFELCERAKHATFVPIPPSQARDASGHDDRNYRMLRRIVPTTDVRELLLQKQSRDPLHANKIHQRSHTDLLMNYALNHLSLQPTPKEIWLFDDTLIKGTHFRAAKEFLQRMFPEVPVVGFFVARSIVKQPQNLLVGHSRK